MGAFLKEAWLSIFLFLSWPHTLQAQSPLTLIQSMTSQQLVQAGRVSFLNRCSGCHGVNADGNGPAALMLDPRPRNLVTGSFKFRSTPPSTLPAVEDLLRTIDQGVLGTSMPSSRELSAQEKLSLVAYIRSLRPEFNETKGDQVPLAFPPPPKDIFSTKATLFASAKRGQVIYQQACSSCHGTRGRGDGPAAVGLMDSDERPIRPADLSKLYVKGGHTARDLFRAISVGLEGSPMPAYGEALKEKDRWDIVAYLFYLRGVGAKIYSEEDEIK